MSMIMSLKQAPQATLDTLLERPELAVRFWTDEQFVPREPPGWVKWLARFLGGYTPPPAIPEAPEGFAHGGAEVDLDKAWHGLQWLLTKPLSRSEGDEWEIPPPEGFLLSAGGAIEGSDHGYGDDRAVTHGEVARFDRLLQSLPWSELAARFDAEAMNQAQVYPNTWDQSGETDYLAENYERLRDFIATTNQQCLGLVVTLS